MPVSFKFEISLWRRLADHALFPLNMWLSEESSARLGLSPIDHERVRMALPHCRGRLLDVACGNNLLVRSYRNGFGVDVYPYPETDALCESDRLPFRDSSFDSVALLACLNHITCREQTLAECRRVLRDYGVLIITMIPPWVGFFSHRIRRRHDPDQLGRGMSHEEDWGITSACVLRMLQDSDFRLAAHRRFMWGLNSLFVAQKISTGSTPIENGVRS